MSHESIVQPIRREVDVYVAISRARELARLIGFDEIDRTRIEIAILELTRNILVHAGSGQLALREIIRDQHHGMEIETSDTGPGIIDVELALRDGYSTAHTLGAGLPGVKRLMDEMVIETTIGVGTTVRTVRWLPTKQRGRR